MKRASSPSLLWAAAKKVARRAHAPYSRFYVGAAVLTAKGNVYVGCNVENVSYGLTICAERSAIFSAVAVEGPRTRITSIAVLNRDGKPCAPCGACRQVMAEFSKNAQVFFDIGNGRQHMTTNELLPASFELHATG